jgi:CII-binding regulator of phage lambda lysogenization HflD
MATEKKQPRTISTILNEVIERVNDDTQRLRVLEQSSESLLSRMNMLEQAMLQNRKESQKNLGETAAKISALDERLAKSENTVKEIISHMKKLVTESQLKELEGLVDIYNPVKSNFVTREELERMLGEKSGKPGKTNNK